MLLNAAPSQILVSLVRLSIVLVFMTVWGCTSTSKLPNPKYTKGIALIVETKNKKQPTNECEVHVGLLNNTQANLNRRSVKYRVRVDGLDTKTSIVDVDADYQADDPIKPGQVGDKKVYKTKFYCSGIGAEFIKLEASGLFGRTYKPEKNVALD